MSRKTLGFVYSLVGMLAAGNSADRARFSPPSKEVPMCKTLMGGVCLLVVAVLATARPIPGQMVSATDQGQSEMAIYPYGDPGGVALL